MAKGKKKSTTTAATIGYEAQLWQMADALRGSMDAAEYKHVVLGLVFLKYIADAFEEQSRTLASLRDTLLPKLISGELRVDDPQRLVAEAIT